jgi:hypothetical protein
MNITNEVIVLLTAFLNLNLEPPISIEVGLLAAKKIRKELHEQIVYSNTEKTEELKIAGIKIIPPNNFSWTGSDYD